MPNAVLKYRVGAITMSRCSPPTARAQRDSLGPRLRLVGAQILDPLGRLVFQLAGLVSGLATQIGSLFLGPHVDGLLGRLEFGSRFQSLSGSPHLNNTLAIGISCDG